ncbi:MAG: methyltransferase domain-containing protein [Planctomycetota bacterium]
MKDYRRSYYPESRFGGFTHIDGTIAFYLRVNALIAPSSVVLDVGCGSGAHERDPVAIRRQLRILKGKCRKVIGLDVDENAGDNPFLDEFRLIRKGRWPVEDDEADVCVCDNVLEHVEDPAFFFSECRRTIKPEGHLCIRTPNVLSYFGLLSRMIPSGRRSAVLEKVRDSARKDEDVFPTYYRCNTTRKLRRMFKEYGFTGCVLGYEAEPSYLSLSRFLYFLGVLHQRFAPRAFRVAIFAFGKKGLLT